MTAPTTLKRIQENPLAFYERRLLNWICARLPAWTTPDHLTLLGILGAILVFAGYAASNLAAGWLWLSVLGYCVHWFGDSLDGSLARFRAIERPKFGYFVDHSADLAGALLIVGGIGISPFVRLDSALLALAGYYLLASYAFLSARVVGELKLSYVAAGPTELRLMLIGLSIAMFGWGSTTPGPSPYNGFDLFVGAVGVILIGLFFVQTVTMARRLSRQGE